MSEDGPYQLYKDLNQDFADMIVNNYKEGDISKCMMCVSECASYTATS